MSDSVSYELYRQKRGRWIVDSVYDDREMALYEAKKLLQGQFRSSIKVVEERFNANSGESTQRVIFTGRGTENAERKVQEVKQQQAEQLAREHRSAPHKTDNLTAVMVRMVLILGGIGLVTLAAVYLLLDQMG